MVEHKLLNTIQDRLDSLSKMPKIKKNSSIAQALKENGFTRRDFMK